MELAGGIDDFKFRFCRPAGGQDFLVSTDQPMCKLFAEPFVPPAADCLLLGDAVEFFIGLIDLQNI